jgi:hypothetical protein
LGTFIAANTGIVAWWKQWIWIAVIFNATTVYSWVAYEGDITHERLKSKGFDTAPTSLNYLQTAVPIILLILTRMKIPVSTTFMVLTVFVTKSKTLGKTILKSVSGYGLSMGLALIVYLPFCSASRTTATSEETTFLSSGLLCNGSPPVFSGLSGSCRICLTSPFSCPDPYIG